MLLVKVVREMTVVAGSEFGDYQGRRSASGQDPWIIERID